MANYYYNGVLLPEIPADIMANYPNTLLYEWVPTEEFLLMATPDGKQFYYNSSSNELMLPATTRYERYKISNGEWVLESAFTDMGDWICDNVNGVVIWSNYNVTNGYNSDVIYLNASDPVPEGGVEPEPEPEQGYSSIDEIVAGVSNATQLRTNSKQDDGTDAITGVDWFSYGGTVCNSIYASGNSWIGLGSSSEHLKVNRRDAAMWNLWREEGIVKGRRFLRIRWSGYTAYSSTSTSALLTFDVILLETGDIVLYIVDVPTSNYSGTFTLGSLTYEKPTADNRYVTFYLQADGSYIVDYNQIDLSIKKYLVRNESTLYTVADGALVEVSGTLNADLFISSGVDDMPDGALLMTLSAPEVLCWTDGDKVPTLTAIVQGTPVGTHEIVSDNAIIEHESIYGITSVEATASDGAMFFLSFDGGAWMTYTDGSWSASDTGMTASELIAIPTDAWQSVINSAQTMRLKAIIDGVENVTQVKFNFNNTPPI